MFKMKYFQKEMDRKLRCDVLVSSYLDKRGLQTYLKHCRWRIKHSMSHSGWTKDRICDLSVLYLYNSLPPSKNSKNKGQEHHHQPSYHGVQWELEGLVWGMMARMIHPLTRELDTVYSPFNTKFWLCDWRLYELTCYFDLECLGAQSIDAVFSRTHICAFVQALYRLAIGQLGVKSIGGLQQTRGFQIHVRAVKCPPNGLDWWIGPDVATQLQGLLVFYSNFLWPGKLWGIWREGDRTAVTHKWALLIIVKWEQR